MNSPKLVPSWKRCGRCVRISYPVRSIRQGEPVSARVVARWALEVDPAHGDASASITSSCNGSCPCHHGESRPYGGSWCAGHCSSSAGCMGGRRHRFQDGRCVLPVPGQAVFRDRGQDWERPDRGQYPRGDRPGVVPEADHGAPAPTAAHLFITQPPLTRPQAAGTGAAATASAENSNEFSPAISDTAPTADREHQPNQVLLDVYG